MLHLIKSVKTNWRDLLQKNYYENRSQYKELENVLIRDKQNFQNLQDIYPPDESIFKTFDFFDIENLKVVILGQDPYHGPNQAMGMCFSVPDNIKIPPSLVNIYKEIKNSYPKYNIPKTGDLTHWNQQGILLLNTSLTVRQSCPNCYSKYWRDITNNMIKQISNETEDIVFLLWGNHAISKKKFIDSNKHYILESKHPSPLSANRGGWFGCQHFLKTNEILKSLNKNEINW